MADLPPLYPDERRKKGQIKSRDDHLGCVHVGIKQLPKLRVGGREIHKGYFPVATDRCSRSVHFAVKEDMTEPNATVFLHEAAAAFPFRLTHVLIDRGSCFTTSAFSEDCSALDAQHRTTKPYTPQANGIAERFDSRIEREVPTFTVVSYRDLCATHPQSVDRPPAAEFHPNISLLKRTLVVLNGVLRRCRRHQQNLPNLLNVITHPL